MKLAIRFCSCLFVTLHLLMSESSVLPPDGNPSDTCNSCCQGQAGLPGIPGTAGTAGIPGSPGNHGLPGRDGMNGGVGIKGDIGEHGERGEKGFPGPQGPSGERGSLGLQGLPGKVGPRGVEGMSGLNGDSGIEGMKGQQGEIGLETKSAFSVAKTSSQTGNVGDILIFDMAHTNIGEDFSLSSNKFTCQVPGTYVFMFTITTISHSHHPIIELVKDGVGIARAVVLENDSPGSEWLQGSQSAVLQLAAGGQVWLKFEHYTGQQVYSSTDKYTTFSGFLLYEE